MIQHGKKPYLECSSKGDRRFSAFYAQLKCMEGRTVEEIYQSAKSMMRPTIDNVLAYVKRAHDPQAWRKNKGKPATNPEMSAKLYDALWDKYLEENPDLIQILLEAEGVSDVFGQKGHCCQATSLWKLRTKYRRKLDVSGKKAKLDRLRRSIVSYWVGKKWSLHEEFGLASWGKYRADLIGVSYSGRIVILELKSSLEDLMADKKMHRYRKFSHAMYLCLDADVWRKAEKRGYKLHKDIGVITLEANQKYARVKRPARWKKEEDFDDDMWAEMILKLAWRGGKWSPRTTKKMPVKTE